jgi:murein DD-endopeptidase MepM/ murein hydrolase activator NlpD
LFVRQRLSSERDRYRGKRRVPTPPRSRYAVVGLSAFLGAGAVALGAASQLPDAKAVNPTILAKLADSSTANALTERDAGTERASRGQDRAAAARTDEKVQDIWLLPLDEYEFTAPYGVRWGKLHAGVDLAISEGTVYSAVHGGKVILAQWYGGYGYCIMIDHGNGLVTVYGHSSELLVKQGDTVKAGQVIGVVGSTGHSTGPRLHLEIHVNGTAVDPVPWFKQHGVDLKLQMESVY